MSSKDRQELDAGIRFLGDLGLMKTAAMALKPPTIKAAVAQRPVAQLQSVGMRPARSMFRSSPPRVGKLSVPTTAASIPGTGVTKQKRAFVENTLRGGARAVQDVVSPITSSMKNYGRGVHLGAFGNRDAAGKLIKDPNILRRAWSRRHKDKSKWLLKTEDRAKAEGPDFYRGYLRGKGVDDGMGSKDLLTEAFKTYGNVDGSFTAASVLDGAANSGLLTLENMRKARDFVKLPAKPGYSQRAMVGAGAAAGGLGLGAGALMARNSGSREPRQ